MMNQIDQDIKECMKSRQKEKLEVLRYLKARFLENKTSAKPQSEEDVLIAHVKKMRSSLEQFPAGSDLRVKTEKEIEILQTYLPKSLEENEVQNFIAGIVKSLEAPSMGAVMKELTPMIKGRFDGKRASELVQAAVKAHLEK